MPDRESQTEGLQPVMLRNSMNCVTMLKVRTYLPYSLIDAVIRIFYQPVVPV